MANRHRGEIEAVFDGRRWTLCLTLGALAELEEAFGVGDLGALAERFAQGRLSARDAVRVLGAGLRGAGNMVEDEHVERMTTVGGAAGFAAIVGDLLRVTFGDPPDAETDDTDDAGEEAVAGNAGPGSHPAAHPSARVEATAGPFVG